MMTIKLSRKEIKQQVSLSDYLLRRLTSGLKPVAYGQHRTHLYDARSLMDAARNQLTGLFIRPQTKNKLEALITWLNTLLGNVSQPPKSKENPLRAIDGGRSAKYNNMPPKQKKLVMALENMVHGVKELNAFMEESDRQTAALEGTS
jgi:hypothetical protein